MATNDTNTKDALVHHLTSAYRILNKGDASDKEPWMHVHMPRMAGHLDRIFDDLVNEGILTHAERQAIYDTL